MVFIQSTRSSVATENEITLPPITIQTPLLSIGDSPINKNMKENRTNKKIVKSIIIKPHFVLIFIFYSPIFGSLAFISLAIAHTTVFHPTKTKRISNHEPVLISRRSTPNNAIKTDFILILLVQYRNSVTLSNIFI